MRALSILLVLLFTSCAQNQQTNPEGKSSSDKPTSEVEETFHIEFMAYNHSSDGQKSPGHMFVEYWRNQNGSFVSYGRYGFGPDEGYTRDHFINGVPWKGKFGNEPPGNPDVRFMKMVSREKWEKAWQVKEDWKNTSREYIGGSKDCITFGLEVSSAAGLKSVRALFPSWTVQLLSDNNPLLLLADSALVKNVQFNYLEEYKVDQDWLNFTPQEYEASLLNWNCDSLAIRYVEVQDYFNKMTVNVERVSEQIKQNRNRIESHDLLIKQKEASLKDIRERILPKQNNSLQQCRKLVSSLPDFFRRRVKLCNSLKVQVSRLKSQITSYEDEIEILKDEKLASERRIVDLREMNESYEEKKQLLLRFQRITKRVIIRKCEDKYVWISNDNVDTQ